MGVLVTGLVLAGSLILDFDAGRGVLGGHRPFECERAFVVKGHVPGDTAAAAVEAVEERRFVVLLLHWSHRLLICLRD